jgi:uncharacterized protein GlcG (DUF336 family)
MPHHRLPALALLFGLTAGASADDLVQTRTMSLELAADIARGAVAACRELGYQVSAVVVDRSGVTQVVMRDALASRFNTEIARKKANAVVLGAVSTTEFLANRPEIIAAMNQLDDVLVLRGALPVRAAGSLLGAVGVSGALGGDKDEACAQKALDAVAERLAFAD